MAKIGKTTRKKDTEILLTEAQVKQYETIYPLLSSTYEEMKSLSSKKQDGVLNHFKVKNLNRLIDTARELLKNETVLEYLEKLDEETLPQNSDVVLMLCQYIDGLNQLRTNNQITDKHYHTKWKTQENPYPFTDDDDDDF